MKIAGFKDPQSYSLPVLVAVGLHLVLLIVMSTQWISSQEAPRVKPIKAISAKVIQVENKQAKKRKEDKIRQQKQTKKKADKKRKDDARKKAERKKKLDKKRAADKKAAAKKAADKKAAKKKADAKRKADLKKKADAKRKADAANKRAAAAEKQRQAALATEARQRAAREALDAALQEELVAEQASADQAAVNDYANAIRLQIMRFWVTPPSARRTDKLKLRLQLLPTGEVAAVTVTKASGNTALDRSAEQAVHRAKPFTVPKDALLFEKLRVINIDMSPENLRW